ncbi:unnamed protein product [Cladocopium goreaui]|uniref:Retrovirus-related Pol polyprotein from transposon TNT 1-94 n=1 Tax=Cladocopium goreaui TaxID=2562237 RepID=A0A9P1FT56_9DINO|nr:unnamed protein product [Cladocopium goreaui]
MAEQAAPPDAVALANALIEAAQNASQASVAVQQLVAQQPSSAAASSGAAASSQSEYANAGKMVRMPDPFTAQGAEQEQTAWGDFELNLKAWLFAADPRFEKDFEDNEKHLDTGLDMDVQPDDVQTRSQELHSLFVGLLRNRSRKTLRAVNGRNGFEVYRQLQKLYKPSAKPRSVALLSALMSLPNFNTEEKSLRDHVRQIADESSASSTQYASNAPPPPPVLMGGQIAPSVAASSVSSGPTSQQPVITYLQPASGQVRRFELGAQLACLDLEGVSIKEEFIIASVTSPLVSLGRMLQQTDDDCVGHLRAIQLGETLQRVKPSWTKLGAECFGIKTYRPECVDSTLAPTDTLMWYRTILVKRGGSWHLYKHNQFITDAYVQGTLAEPIDDPSSVQEVLTLCHPGPCTPAQLGFSTLESMLDLLDSNISNTASSSSSSQGVSGPAGQPPVSVAVDSSALPVADDEPAPDEVYAVAEEVEVNGVRLNSASPHASLKAACAVLGIAATGNRPQLFKTILQRLSKDGLLASHVVEQQLSTEMERVALSPHVPSTPTEAEMSEHCLTHIPFRDWCTLCIANKSRQDQHQREGHSSSTHSVVSFDFGFSGRGVSDDDSITVLFMHDRATKMMHAVNNVDSCGSDGRPLFEPAAGTTGASLSGPFDPFRRCAVPVIDAIADGSFAPDSQRSKFFATPPGEEAVGPADNGDAVAGFGDAAMGSAGVGTAVSELIEFSGGGVELADTGSEVPSPSPLALGEHDGAVDGPQGAELGGEDSSSSESGGDLSSSESVVMETTARVKRFRAKIPEGQCWFVHSKSHLVHRHDGDEVDGMKFTVCGKRLSSNYVPCTEATAWNVLCKSCNRK